MATPKKKHLIELMIEAGVKWPDGAEYAAQDKNNNDLCFYRIKPMHNPRFKGEWRPSELSNPSGIVGDRVELPSLCSNWNKTIVTREQYAEAVAERRPAHFPARPPETFMCRCIAAPVSRTIEQLTADYHGKAAEADRLQSVADDALRAADDALLALEKAGELIGLVISIDTKPERVDQPNITDWRDLQVGDVVECVDYADNKQGVIVSIDNSDSYQPIKVNRYGGCMSWPTNWRFIRRP